MVGKFIITNMRNYLIEKVSLDDVELNSFFWKWFSGSKVKKGNKPLILYHGTKTKFDIFTPSKSIGNQGEIDQVEGMYFTDNRDAASFFSISNDVDDDDDRYIKPVFLLIKNPYITNTYNEMKDELGISKLSEANKKLKSLGCDGLIVKRGFYAMGGPYTLYLTFYPNQIKSVNNDGTWDIDDNNIYS